MKHEINIYGDIVAFKYWNDGSEYDRSDLNKAIDSLDLKKGDELIYNIHTFGGCTTTAFAMYNKLLRVKAEKEITLTSRADGFCASSGVILLLAGDKRIGSSYLKPFVHNAWVWSDAQNKEEAKKTYEELEQVDNSIAQLYAERTSINKEKALELMSESRDVTLDECIEFGFYTETENVYSAENKVILNSLRSKNSKNRSKIKSKNKMAKEALTKKEANKKFKSLGETLNGILDVVKGKKSTKNLLLQDANGAEIDFTDLEADATPSVGDKATIDGETATGEHVMPTGETYVFVDGELTEIKEASSDDEPTEEMENLQTENSELKTENKKLKKNLKKVSKEVKNFTKDFNEFKDNASSTFKYNPKMENKKEQKGKKNKSRNRKFKI
jgi:ATP-dependent protease ClpP protease subunit